LKWRLPSTGFALRFDATDFAAYDLFILSRPNAEKDYTAERQAAARARFEAMSESIRTQLEQTIIAGLPGAEAIHDHEGMLKLLVEYSDLSADDLRNNLIEFLREVVPVAEEKGVRLAIHPDDPPFSLFGLPRVVSTADDARTILAGCDSQANGLTFCVGSYGVRADNDLLAMVEEFAARIHFVHLRQVQREGDGSFHEAEHLDGSSDMTGIIHRFLLEEKRRRSEGRLDHEIPMRPDHGHLLADDVRKNAYPGYSLVGRLKGLAELRGVIAGLKYAMPELAR
jgi:mannonate dehydratase